MVSAPFDPNSITRSNGGAVILKVRRRGPEGSRLTAHLSIYNWSAVTPSHSNVAQHRLLLDKLHERGINLHNQNILNNYLCVAPNGAGADVCPQFCDTRKEKCVSMTSAADRMKALSPASSSLRTGARSTVPRFEFASLRRAIAVATPRFRRPHSAPPFLIANPRLEPHLTSRKQTPEKFLIAHFHWFFFSSLRPARQSPANAGPARRSTAKAGLAFLIDRAYRLEIALTPSKIITNRISNRRWIAILPFVFSTPYLRFPRSAKASHSPVRRSLGEGGSLITRRCSMLDFAQQFPAKKFRVATADRWNFGLCATIPREPRQARKGATVTGQLRVPRITRSSSSRSRAARITTQDSQ